ncbi:MAG: DUF5996 family protein [Candidatus Thiodiazotropha endolucinida]|nr:DUF5996 family protein [Candidatus Thiodiazotropha taylori]MCW4319306.1 DUF5996 family protein [Candidatus Thiodiazotropha taylori]
MSVTLPSLTLVDWLQTRDAIHQYARIMGKIRGFYMPKAKHWWHITLTVNAHGLTTTPFPVSGRNLEMQLDLISHQLSIYSDSGWHCAIPLKGNSAAGMRQQITQLLATQGIELDEQRLGAFDDENILTYDADAADDFRRALCWIDVVFRTFKGGLRQETSPVQLFPHHLDIAMNWFSGRLVPGVDPDDEENADEQMNFGFVSGDASIDEAYFYVTAYPMPENWSDLALPEGAYWHSEGWVGAILPYARLLEANDPQVTLLEFLQQVQGHGAALMNSRS